MTKNHETTIQNTLEKLIAIPHDERSYHDQNIRKECGPKELIYQKLTTKKFRSHSLPYELEEEVKKKINTTVENNQPIHITVPFGGYKLWRLPTSPNPDWSEVFNILQLRNYLISITKFYKPGVILEYFSDEIMVARMNNIPQNDLDNYTNNVQKIIDVIRKTLPKNFILKFMIFLRTFLFL